jgi:preprotein translocase subunit SecY
VIAASVLGGASRIPKRLLITLAFVLIFRVIAHIPLPF